MNNKDVEVVPWSTKEEWKTVYRWLYSQNPNLQQKGLERKVSKFDCTELDDAMTLITDLDTLMRDLISGDQMSAIQAVRKMTVSHPHTTDELIRLEILPFLVECLKQNDRSDLQFEVEWILTNIAAGTSVHTRAVVQAESVPLLLQLFQSQDRDVCEQAIWTIGNLLGDSDPQLRDYMSNSSVIGPLLSLIRPDVPVRTLRLVSWAMFNLCSIKHKHEKPAPIETIWQIVPALGALVRSCTDTEVLKDTLWALTCVTSGSDEQIQVVLDAGVIQHVVPLLLYMDSDVLKPVILILGNVLIVSQEMIQFLLSLGTLAYFPLSRKSEH